MNSLIKYIYILLLLLSLMNSYSQTIGNYVDTLLLSTTGDTALTVTGILPQNGEMKIHFLLYSKNNNKEINIINEAKEFAPFKEKTPLVSLIPKSILEFYHLQYFAVKIPNDTLSNKDIEISTTVLKKRIGEIDEKHKDTVFYCKIRQEIKHHGKLLLERKEETALMYKSLENHFDIKLYKWYCPQLQKYIINVHLKKTKYERKTDRYKSVVTTRILFT